ncbi:glycosyltransferase family 2 protein [Candidatus Pelagibacter sp. Uisw_121]|uniref:glycosyltransferase family 2 protein n=1 Tax=Candidatus Pelagibacter sp. Uisw_121 TaxID=3230987 RepID=UPI0039E82ADB
MDLISVIIPYYKKKEYIISSINSVLNQTYKNLEIIIIYDDLNKKDLNLLKKIKKKDKRIKIYINKKNLGAGRSRNKGIKLSKGVFVAFLDSDDLWKKNKLKKQIFFMKKNGINASHTSYTIINSNNKIVGSRNAKDMSYKLLLKSCDIGLSTVVLKKEIITSKIKFANIKTKEDYVLWLKITFNNNKIFALKDNLTKWRKLEDSLSSSRLQKIYDGYLVYRKYMNFNLLKSFGFLMLLSFNYFLKDIKNK